MPRRTETEPVPSRRERARATRKRICDRAYDAFCELGYGATTMNEVAQRAGVAVQTVYFTFHTKAELFTEVVVERSGGPDAGTPVMERAWMKEVIATGDSQRAMALITDHGTDIFRRLAPLWGAMVTASSEDPDFAARFAAIVEARRGGMRRVLERIAATGGLGPGVTAERAADSLFLLQSPQVLSMATSNLGWSVEKLKAWSFTQMLPLLAEPVWRPAATEGSTFHDVLADFATGP